MQGVAFDVADELVGGLVVLVVFVVFVVLAILAWRVALNAALAVVDLVQMA